MGALRVREKFVLDVALIVVREGSSPALLINRVLLFLIILSVEVPGGLTHKLGLSLRDEDLLRSCVLQDALCLRDVARVSEPAFLPGGVDPTLTRFAIHQPDEEGEREALRRVGRSWSVTNIGGEKMKLSGTSMAAPQVANLAAKLFAMRPELSVAQAKQLILEGAERNGRVNLIDPKKTLALAGAKL